jgi:hypothetical protein
LSGIGKIQQSHFDGGSGRFEFGHQGGAAARFLAVIRQDEAAGASRYHPAGHGSAQSPKGSGHDIVSVRSEGDLGCASVLGIHPAKPQYEAVLLTKRELVFIARQQDGTGGMFDFALQTLAGKIDQPAPNSRHFALTNGASQTPGGCLKGIGRRV